MSKESITLNGFNGGINNDADPTDLVALGGQDDEVTVASNIFLDYRGKIILEYPDLTANSSGTSGVTDGAAGFTNDATADKCLVYGGKFYQRPGIYKIGEVVTFSNDDNYHINHPHEGTLNPATGLSNINEGFDVFWKPRRKQMTEYYDGAAGTNLDIWLSKNAKAASSPVSTIMGKSSYKFGEVVCEWVTAETSYGTQASAGKFYQSGPTGKYFTAQKWIDNRIWSHTDNGNHINNLGQQSNWMLCKQPDHDNVINTPALTGSSASAASGRYYKFADHDLSISTPNGMTQASIDAVGAVDISSASEFQQFHGNGSGTWNHSSRVYDTETHSSNSSSHRYSYGRGGSHLTFVTGSAGYNTVPWQNKGVYATFNNGTTLNHFSAAYAPNINNKTLAVEYKWYGTNDPTNDNVRFNGFYVVLSSHINGFSDGATADVVSRYAQADGSTTEANHFKIFRLTMSQIDAEGGKSDWVRHLFAWGDAHYTGSSFDPAQVTWIMFGWEKNKTGHTGSGFGSNSVYSADMKPIIALRELAFIENITSGWVADNEYIAWQTRLKNEVESLPKKLGVVKVYGDDQKITISRPATAGYTGRMYYQLTDDQGDGIGEKFLIADVSQADGVKAIIHDEYQPWDETTSPHSYYFTLEHPPGGETFTFSAGYPDNALSINALYKTSAVVGRQVYIGNCAQFRGYYRVTGANDGVLTFTASTKKILVNTATTADNNWVTKLENLEAGDVLTVTGSGSNDGEYTVASISTDTDTNDTITVNELLVDENLNATAEFRNYDPYDGEIILKSGIGKSAGYPDSFYIDLEFGGDTINVMESAGDRLFIFSNNGCSIVNVAQDIEFIEATMPQMGVKKHRQVCKVGEGIAFVNDTGVYLFDGQQWQGLSEAKMNTVTWDGDNCAIGYDANRSILHVWNNANDRYFYSMVTQSWTGKSTVNSSIPDTNIANGPLGLAHYEIGGNRKYIGSSINSNSDDNRDFALISCGNFAQRKKFYKLYVTVKGPGSTIRVKYSIDGAANETAVTNGVYGQSTNADQRLIDDATTACKIGGTGKTIQLLFEDISSGTSSDLEISDISLVFRRKKVK